ncbi:hypothetical protein FVE85_9086 [Porphyridium purpureum]|uniref:Uncharacterized protein n=1 Tax=Porphyridium purpureum TaxID=35688 RepID=A0A5J4YQ30_PORPP|nr:hypothetical protein FVE85_9086 [Porphyridium purpureum]|eukprot:POR2382..scf222_8
MKYRNSSASLEAALMGTERASHPGDTLAVALQLLCKPDVYASCRAFVLCTPYDDEAHVARSLCDMSFEVNFDVLVDDEVESEKYDAFVQASRLHCPLVNVFSGPWAAEPAHIDLFFRDALCCWMERCTELVLSQAHHHDGSGAPESGRQVRIPLRAFPRSVPVRHQSGNGNRLEWRHPVIPSSLSVVSKIDISDLHEDLFKELPFLLAPRPDDLDIDDLHVSDFAVLLANLNEANYALFLRTEGTSFGDHTTTFAAAIPSDKFLLYREIVSGDTLLPYPRCLHALAHSEDFAARMDSPVGNFLSGLGLRTFKDLVGGQISARSAREREADLDANVFPAPGRAALNLSRLNTASAPAVPLKVTANAVSRTGKRPRAAKPLHPSAAGGPAKKDIRRI